MHAQVDSEGVGPTTLVFPGIVKGVVSVGDGKLSTCFGISDCDTVVGDSP